MTSASLYSTKIILNILKDILLFPLWWYSFGLIKLLKFIKHFISNKQKSLALFIWIKNIFVPMYGQYNWSGRLISFSVRLFQIIFRTIIMILWLVLAICILFIWLSLPVYSIYQIIMQLF